MKYKVRVSELRHGEVEVEASSEREAKSKATGMEIDFFDSEITDMTAEKVMSSDPKSVIKRLENWANGNTCDGCPASDDTVFQAAELLQKVQLTVQGGLHHRGELARSSLPHTDGLGLQHGVGKIIAQIGGVGKQGGFKGGYSIAQGGDGIVSRFQPVGQRRQLCHNGVVQQGAENNKPVEPGVPFTKLHRKILSF
mgnify:CR=1 FL=1